MDRKFMRLVKKSAARSAADFFSVTHLAPMLARISNRTFVRALSLLVLIFAVGISGVPTAHASMVISIGNIIGYPPEATSGFDNVLFLPGIEGSRLYEGTGCGNTTEEKLWEPADPPNGSFWSTVTSAGSILAGEGDAHVAALGLTASGKSGCSDIYAKPGDIVGSIYQSFENEMNNLVASGTIQAWEPVAYDWRLSLNDIVDHGVERNGKIYYEDATSTPYIEQTLKTLAATSRTGKVTIIAHSNGGLVAKALLQKLGNTEAAKLVDKVILVDSPQDGTPADIGSLLVGYGAGIYEYGLIPVVSNQAARAFAQNSPMAYHLLPSAAYIASAGHDPAHPLVSFEGRDYQKAEAAYGSVIDTTQGLDNFLVAAGHDRTPPSSDDLYHTTIANPQLLAYATSTHATLDAWVPPTGITVDQVAGWGVDTVSGIDFYTPSVSQRSLACVSCALQPEYRPTFVEDGDGTVTVPSALMMASSTNVKRYWVDLHTYNKQRDLKITHANILELPSIETFIKNILTNSTSTLPAYISAHQPAPITNQPQLTFFLHSPLSLELTDASGRTTGIAPDGSVAENIPDSTYGQFGEVKYITVPEGNAYALAMHGLARGTFSLDVEERSGGATVASSTIAHVPTTASTTVAMHITSGLSTLSPMTVDENGDGTIDATITPKLGQTVVFDSAPPELEVTFSTTTKAIVWNAVDQNGLATVTAMTNTQRPLFGKEGPFKEKNTVEGMLQREQNHFRPSVTNVTARDAAGNTTVLSYVGTPWLPLQSALDLITLKTIAYNGATTTLSGASISYDAHANARTGALQRFTATLRTASSTVTAVYQPHKNETIITTRVSLPPNLHTWEYFDWGDLVRPRRQVLPGLVIPYMETKNGNLIIGY